MKIKDNRLFNSLYRVDADEERIAGINIGRDMICEISRLLSGNKNKLDNVEVSTFTNSVHANGYDVVIIRDEQRIELFISNNNINFTFNIPNNNKCKVKIEEEPVEQTAPEEIEAEVEQEHEEVEQEPVSSPNFGINPTPEANKQVAA
jgi:hypothetical protein